MKLIHLLLLSVLLLSGCASAGDHRRHTRDEAGDRLTVGKVQREIKIGMSSAEVAEVLGSPNVVSSDEERREVWIYDKISTDVSYSTSEAGASILIVGGIGSSGARSTSQRTLTIIIKFDRDGKVRDFAYHTSRF
ncbi:MAG: outer membrane protein assembly factor BamE [Candidatus Omnitrophica bacterium]|nr:outer membrane protein assembly factor BamE [Candidatus Omnitrophota bacterium]